MTGSVKDVRFLTGKKGRGCPVPGAAVLSQVGAVVAPQLQPAALVRIDVDRAEQLAPLAEMDLPDCGPNWNCRGWFCNRRAGR